MALTKTATASVVINRAAVEIGLSPQEDPFGSLDDAFVQLRYLLNTAGEELMEAHAWEWAVKTERFTTAEEDTGDYQLPADFLSMTNQTGWDETNRVPLFGPLSAQDWTYVIGRDLVSSTIYASFRLQKGLFSLFPQPPNVGQTISYEYKSKDWVQYDNAGTPAYRDEVLANDDVVLFDRTLISRYLKVKFLEAKGLESTKARDDFAQHFSFVTGAEKGAEILRAGGRGRGVEYLDSYRNTPDSGYGLY